MTSSVSTTPCDFVVFGGTGDLARRKLLPALYLRDRDRQLAEETRVVSVSRSGDDGEAYRNTVRADLHRFLPAGEIDERAIGRFLDRLHHISMDVLDPDGDRQLVDLLGDGDRIRVFYLACAPGLFGPVCEWLAVNKLVTDSSRVVLEKPIGHDLASAREINDAVGRVFDESQTFRIDHYLGKESVQNLLVMRFANILLEPLWNSAYVDHVQITVAESLGVGARGGYYDDSGALRDMVQNHLLQLLCLVAMEPPAHVGRETVRDEKLKVLRALRTMAPADVAGSTVRGQYDAGLVDGVAVPGYQDELSDPDRDGSRTETFVALKADIDNWRWAGVPFYLRTGKRLDRRCSQIVVQFKQVPHAMFPGSEGSGTPNRLVIQLQPDEGIRLHMTAKEPGPGGIRLRPVSLNLSYADTFRTRTPDAYERLLMDVVRGNPTLFMRRDEVEEAWAWTEPILHAWQQSGVAPRRYPAGTHGPTAASTLLEREGRSWHEEDTP